MGLDRVVPALACPLCGSALVLDDRVLADASGHRFDVARHGSVTLLPGRSPGTGDGPDSVAARERVHASGFFDPVADAVRDAVAARASGSGISGPDVSGLVASGLVVDAGGGDGWYLARVLDALPGLDGLVLDLSESAVRRAARAHPRMAAVRADLWSTWPLRDDAAEVVLDVFSPRNPTETARVLAPGGVLVVVTPTRAHLGELRTAVGLLDVDAAKPERLAAAFAREFDDPVVERLAAVTTLPRAALRDLVAMGPSAHHVPPERLDELPDELPVALDVEVRVYRRH